MIQFDPTPIKTFEVDSFHRICSLISYSNNLYFSEFHEFEGESIIKIYNLNGDYINTIPNLSFNQRANLDFYGNKFYVIDSEKVYIYNLNFNKILSFDVPGGDNLGYNNIKVDNSLIYITLEDHPDIFLYNHKGKYLKLIDRTFQDPRGMALDKDRLYVCDSPARVAILLKLNYSFEKEWGSPGTGNGQFEYLNTIHLYEDLLSVADKWAIQFFTREGEFLQRLQFVEYSCPWNSCIINDLLYLYERVVRNVQVFRMK